MFISISVLLCVIVLAYSLSLIAPRLGLLAYPGEHRQHKEPTPMVGGIAIFFGISLGMFLTDSNIRNILPSMLLLCVVGVLDDRFKLPSWLRIIVQVAAAYLMVELTGIQLFSLGGLIEINIEAWSLPLTIFAIVGVINAFNMSDGLDGLVGLLSIMILFSLLLFNQELQDFILIFIAAITGFLFWNIRFFRHRAKLFLGDAGSTMIGLVIVYLLIQSSQSPLNNIQPVTALWLLALPLFDAVAVLLIRPLRGRSPFSADRMHYHHFLLDRGMSVNATLFSVLVLQAIMILIGSFMFLEKISEITQFKIFLSLFAGYLFIINSEATD